MLLVALAFAIHLIYSKGSVFISPLGEENADSAKVEKLLREKNISFSGISILSDSSYLITISNNGQVRFSSQKDIDKQVSSLQRIVRELTIEGKQFKIIDFRFSEPIISF